MCASCRFSRRFAATLAPKWFGGRSTKTRIVSIPNAGGINAVKSSAERLAAAGTLAGHSRGAAIEKRANGECLV